ncbi:MAG: protein translocase subunit SecF [Holosporaceae bacterium]|jgi:preprotein translocase SecF subunit|nr:protein translocase subunit SecF [Holosporaceae bacterium]
MEVYKLIPHDTKIDFVKYRRYTYAFSIIITLISLLTFAFHGLNFGIDFRGGFVMEIRSRQEINLADLREKLTKLDIGEVYLQEFGSKNDVLVRIPASAGKTQKEQNTSLEKVKEVLGHEIEYRKVEKIGPKVGGELVHDAILAVIISLAAILMYIWIRFEWQFAVCGVIALAHDCIVLMGLYSLCHYFEFNVNSIVALLMTACYSIHDTVVVFDRIRENMAAYRTLTLVELLNKSINETLSRTVLTSFTTVLSLLALCFFGGKVIFDFCFPILFGLTFGTFSSICLSAPLLLFTGVKTDGKDVVIGLKKATTE